MGLMLFSESQYTDKHRYLLSKEFRVELAERVNKELLAVRGDNRPSSQLEDLVKTRVWVERKATEKGLDLPSKIDIGLEGLVGRVQQQGNGGNGSSGAAGGGNNDGNDNGNNAQAQDGDAMET